MTDPVNAPQSPSRTDDSELGYAPRYHQSGESDADDADEPLAYKLRYNSVYRLNVPAPDDATTNGEEAVSGNRDALQATHSGGAAEPSRSTGAAEAEGATEDDDSDEDERSFERVIVRTRNASISARNAVEAAAALAARTAAISDLISSGLTSQSADASARLLEQEAAPVGARWFVADYGTKPSHSDNSDTPPANSVRGRTDDDALQASPGAPEPEYPLGADDLAAQDPSVEPQGLSQQTVLPLPGLPAHEQPSLQTERPRHPAHSGPAGVERVQVPEQEQEDPRMVDPALAEAPFSGLPPSDPDFAPAQSEFTDVDLGVPSLSALGASAYGSQPKEGGEEEEHKQQQHLQQPQTSEPAAAPTELLAGAVPPPGSHPHDPRIAMGGPLTAPDWQTPYDEPADPPAAWSGAGDAAWPPGQSVPYTEADVVDDIPVAPPAAPYAPPPLAPAYDPTQLPADVIPEGAGADDADEGEMATAAAAGPYSALEPQTYDDSAGAAVSTTSAATAAAEMPPEAAAEDAAISEAGSTHLLLDDYRIAAAAGLVSSELASLLGLALPGGAQGTGVRAGGGAGGEAAAEEEEEEQAEEEEDEEPPMVVVGREMEGLDWATEPAVVPLGAEAPTAVSPYYVASAAVALAVEPPGGVLAEGYADAREVVVDVVSPGPPGPEPAPCPDATSLAVTEALRGAPQQQQPALPESEAQLQQHHLQHPQPHPHDQHPQQQQVPSSQPGASGVGTASLALAGGMPRGLARDPFDAADSDDDEREGGLLVAQQGRAAAATAAVAAGGFAEQPLSGPPGPGGAAPPVGAATPLATSQLHYQPQEYQPPQQQPAGAVGAATATMPGQSWAGPQGPGEAGGHSGGGAMAAVGAGLAAMAGVALGAGVAAASAAGQRTAAAAVAVQPQQQPTWRAPVATAAPPGQPPFASPPSQRYHPAQSPDLANSPDRPLLPTSLRPSASPNPAPLPGPGPRPPGMMQQPQQPMMPPGALPPGHLPPAGPGRLQPLHPQPDPGVYPAAGRGLAPPPFSGPPPHPAQQGPYPHPGGGAPPGVPPGWRPGMPRPQQHPQQQHPLGAAPGGMPGPGPRPGMPGLGQGAAPPDPGPGVGPGGPGGPNGLQVRPGGPMGPYPGPGRAPGAPGPMVGGPGGGPQPARPPGWAGPRPPMGPGGPPPRPPPAPSPFPGLLYTDGRDTLGRPVVVLNTAMLPAKAKKNDVLQYVLQQLQPVVQREYVLVVLSLALGVKAGSVSSTWALGAYRSLAKPYRKNVKHIVLVQPSAWARTLLALAQPFVSKKAAHKIKKVDNLVQISEATDGQVKLESLGARFVREIQYGLGAPPLVGLPGGPPAPPPAYMPPQPHPVPGAAVHPPHQHLQPGPGGGGPMPPGRPGPGFGGPLPPHPLFQQGPNPAGGPSLPYMVHQEQQYPQQQGRPQSASTVSTPVYGPGGPGPATAGRVQGPPPPRPQFAPPRGPVGPGGSHAALGGPTAGYGPAGGVGVGMGVPAGGGGFVTPPPVARQGLAARGPPGV